MPKVQIHIPESRKSQRRAKIPPKAHIGRGAENRENQTLETKTMTPNNKKKSRREHYICNGRMLCLSHATTPPRQCSCGAQIFHIGTPEGAALKAQRASRKHQFSGGFLAKAPKRIVLNRNIGEAADAVAWGGMK